MSDEREFTIVEYIFSFLLHFCKEKLESVSKPHAEAKKGWSYIFSFVIFFALSNFGKDIVKNIFLR